MSKLFEVNNVTYRADRIDSVARLGSERCHVVLGGEQYEINVPYDEFGQLWRKALGEDVRTDE